MQQQFCSLNSAVAVEPTLDNTLVQDFLITRAVKI